MNMEAQTFCHLMNKSLISPTFLSSVSVNRQLRAVRACFAFLDWTCGGPHLLTLCESLFFDGNIQDICSRQRHQKAPWAAHSKGRKATFPRVYVTVFLWAALPKVMGQMERAQGTRLAFTPFPSFCAPPSLCGLARPPDNVNNQERELVSLCDLRLHDTMKGQRNKDMANISIPNI